MSNELFPFEALTIRGGIIETVAAATRKGAIKSDVYEGKDQFIAVILSELTPTGFTDKEVAGTSGTTAPDSIAGDKGAIYGFKERIISADSPHAFLPEPCQDSKNEQINSMIKNMHTTALSRESNYAPGQEVYVQLEKVDFSYNLDSCWIIGPSNSGTLSKQGTNLDCLTSKDAFGNKRITEYNIELSKEGKVGGPSTAADINAAYPAAAAVPGLAEKIVQVANSVGIPDPGWLANLINFESGFDETKQNERGSDCWGLIQFCRTSGAKEVGAIWNAGERPPDDFLNNGPVAQMDYVEKYLLGAKGKYKTIQDVYARVFFPISMKHGDDFSIYEWYVENKGQAAADRYLRQNPGIVYKGDYIGKANGKAKLPTRLSS